MSMNEHLAAMYGTAAPAAPEDLDKVAAEELFIKAAAMQGVNLASMSDEAIANLYADFEAKLAEDSSDEDEKAKKEKAEKEHKEKKAAQEKFAEADFAGRQMAHAYVDELKKIASTSMVHVPGHGSVRESFHGGTKLLARLGDKARAGAKKVREAADRPVSVGMAAGGMAGAGAAHAVAHSRKKGGDKEKEASAIDQLAFDLALSKAASAGFDVEEAGTRINAAFTLGMFADDTKVAAAADADQAIDIRSLEMLEAAGYPVTWNI